MRKKQAATRHVVTETPEAEGLSHPPKENLVDSTPKSSSALETRNFTVDSSGNIVLADGTPVVQPAVVEDTTGFSSQLDWQDGALPRKSQTIDCSPGVLDTVKCTSCASRISPFSVPCEVHPILKVIICKRCLKFYGRGDFPKDDFGKDENCRWCGDGGDLICCDSCSNTFCKSCIKRNIGRTYLHNIEELGENESWNCLLCTKEPLLPLQKQCFEIIQRVRAYHAQRKKRSERAYELWRNRSNAASASTPTPSVTTAISSPQAPPPSISPNHPMNIIEPNVPSANTSAEKPLQVSPAGFNPPGGLNALAAVLAGVTSTCGTQLVAPFGALPQPSDLLAAVSNLQALASVPLNTSSVAPGSTLPDTQPTKSPISSAPASSSASIAAKRPEIPIPPANKNQSSSRGKWGSASNPNSSDWYLENVTVAGILDQISQVQASNIRNATKALRACLETFLSDLRRVETNLSRARTLDDITNIVRSFQSIFRFHFFSRIGNLVSRLQDDPKHPGINRAQSFAVSPTPNGDNNDRCKPGQASEQATSLDSPASSSTIKSRGSLTIDLTDECESVKGARSQAAHPPSIPPTATTHPQVPTAAVTVAKTASALAASSRSPPSSARASRKRPARRKSSPVNARVPGGSSSAPAVRPSKKSRCAPAAEMSVANAAINVAADTATAIPVIPSEAFSDLIEPAATHTAELSTDKTASADCSSASFLNRASCTPVSHSQTSNEADSSANSCQKASQGDSLRSSQPTSNNESGPDTDSNGQFEVDSSSHQSEAEKENNADAAPPIRQSPSRRTVDSHQSATDDGDQNKTSSELTTAVGIFSDNAERSGTPPQLECASTPDQILHNTEVPSPVGQSLISGPSPLRSVSAPPSPSSISTGSSKTAPPAVTSERSVYCTTKEEEEARLKLLATSSSSSTSHDPSDDEGDHTSSASKNSSTRHSPLEDSNSSPMSSSSRLTRSSSRLQQTEETVESLSLNSDSSSSSSAVSDEIPKSRRLAAKKRRTSPSSRTTRSTRGSLRANNKEEQKAKSDSSSSANEDDEDDDDEDDDTVAVKKSSVRRRRTRIPSIKRARRRVRDVSSGDSNAGAAAEGAPDDVEDGEEDDKKAGKLGAEEDGGADSEGEGKRGRKRIRRIIKTKALSTETKTAEALERERRKRLEERQKFYNAVADVTGDVSESGPAARVILDCKEGTKEALVEVDPDFVKHLKPHQVQAVQFLWDSLIESVKEHQANRDRISGAILAHCMGLGKSLSTIAFVHTLLTHGELCGMSTCLIICPVNTLLNWHREWRQWMPANREVDVFEVATQVSKKFRLDVIRRWHSSGGVLLLGYDAYRNLTTTTIKRTRRPAMKEMLTKSLIDPGPDVVVCDEGHLLKNCKAGITKAVSMLKTPKRIVLTGTPLQNSLAEYWTMVNFVKPNLLGSAKEFANRFINPIKNGQHSNSTERDVQLMKKRAHVLFKTLDGCVQRKDYSCLTKYLPPRLEYVLKIRLSEAQRDLYNAFLDSRDNSLEDGELQENRRSLFKDQQTLYRVWTHPRTLRMHENKEARKLLFQDTTSDEDFISSEASSKDEEEEEEEEGEGNDESEEELSVPTRSPPNGDAVDGRSAASSTSSAPAARVTRSNRASARRNEATNSNQNDKKSSKETGTKSPDRNSTSVVNLLSSDDDNGGVDDADYDDEVDGSKGDDTPTIVSSSTDSSLQMSPHIRMDTKERAAKIRAKLALDENVPAVESAKSTDGKPWWHAKYQDEFDHRIDVGSKLHVLFQLIRRCCDIGDKLLIFTQSLFSLDLIEYFLAAIDRQWCQSQGLQLDTESKQAKALATTMENLADSEPPSLAEYFSDMGCNTWRRGKDYERIDGSLNASLRNSLQHQFNSPNKRFRLLIISTRAGGLGVNLTAANRLVIFDVSWNPSHDIQSIFRSYRFGQTKPVYIYRLIAQGTMEEKIYDRQVTKQSLALRVIDEQQVDRHFSEDDLRELYVFEPDIWDPQAAAKRPPPLLPKDRLLADLLSDMPEYIFSYHDHDSLLENRIDEGLTDSERADAWREYEEEKQLGRSYLDYQQRLFFINQQQQQQQQLMMAANLLAAQANNGLFMSPPVANMNPSLGPIRSFPVPPHPNPGFGVGSRMVHRPVSLNPASIPSNSYTVTSQTSANPMLPSPAVPRQTFPPLQNSHPRPQPVTDSYSEAFVNIRNNLLQQYPMLARTPAALHDMSMRLFLATMDATTRSPYPAAENRPPSDAGGAPVAETPPAPKN